MNNCVRYEDSQHPSLTRDAYFTITDGISWNHFHDHVEQRFWYLDLTNLNEKTVFKCSFWILIISGEGTGKSRQVIRSTIHHLHDQFIHSVVAIQVTHRTRPLFRSCWLVSFNTPHLVNQLTLFLSDFHHPVQPMTRPLKSRFSKTKTST